MKHQVACDGLRCHSFGGCGRGRIPYLLVGDGPRLSRKVQRLAKCLLMRALSIPPSFHHLSLVYAYTATAIRPQYLSDVTLESADQEEEKLDGDDR